MKGEIKKIISVVMIVAMTVTNNGLMVFADSVGNIVDHASSVVHETPNYYEETTTVAAYQTYLESENPDVFDDKDTKSSDLVEEAEKEEIESSESLNANESESTENEKEEATTESSEKINEAETIDEETSDAETKSEESVESKEAEKDIATVSDAEETIEQIEEEEIATASEVNNDKDEEETNNVATVSDMESRNNVGEIDVATESEANETIATESELSVAVSTTSQAVENKEIVIATVSKISWKVKKVLIATYASLNVHAKENEKDHMARLASYANVIIINDRGEEKTFKVKLKWKLFKKYDVNAKSDKQSAPIPKDVWRKSLKVDEFINEQEEVIIATSNIANIEERVKDENSKHDDKEFVIKLQANIESKENVESKEEETKEIDAEEKETLETTLAETIQEIIEESTTEIVETEVVAEPTVAGFNNTDEETNDEELATKSETTKDDEEEIENEEEVATNSETTKNDEVENIDSLYANGNEISDGTLSYYDLMAIYLYKLDVQALGDEIIELIDEADKGDIDSSKFEESKEVKEENLLDGFLKLFGVTSDAETDTEDNSIEENKSLNENESLEEYLSKAKVDVIEGVKLKPVVAEFDGHELGAGATHTAHQIAAFVNGQKLDADTIFNSQIGGDTADMLDLSENNKRIKATGSNIFIAGTYFLPSDIKISNQWIVESENTLTLCLNGHNVTFATAGCVKGEGRVVVCNCEGNATITTDSPQYNWRDKWFASTSETYTKWNEHALFSCNEVGIYAKDNNITFANASIKNQYNGRKSISQMEDTEMDEAEYSGDGSLVWGKRELQLFGVKFENNRATRSNGVAANAQLGKMILENCSFTGNKNLTNKGGAVAFNPKATIIYNCTFTNNTASTNGGALYGRSYTNSNETIEIGTVITKTTFEGNTALADGGAIFMDYLCAKGVTIDGTESNKIVFKNNTAGVSGGAIAVKHMRSVDGQDTNAYSYEDATSRDRLLNINYATFEGNAAKGIKLDKNGAIIDDDTSKKENFGGAIYLNSQTVKHITFPTDEPVKVVNINNCTFNDNFTKGYQLEIKAKDISGNFNGETLAKYNVGNYGGAIYANKITTLNIKDSIIKDNQSMTGAGICVKESTMSFIGGELSNGKAYNCSYAATEFYKRVVSPGGGAAYIMSDAHLTISKETKIESNENAFYLDGGSIDLGASVVKDNIGEYLIGYTNYKTNRILFSGVDIRDHEFNEMRKDYASTASDAATGERKYDQGIYAPSYISFKDKNVIKGNKRNFYIKSGTTYTSKKEYANIVMTSSASNLQMDLSQYLFDVPFTDQDISERIGLYYDFDPKGDDQIIAFDKWTHDNVKVIDEGGLWTNYFEIDNSYKGEWADGWKFYIEKNLIRMSPHIVQVKFDSYIENVPRIKPQYYNFRKSGNEKIKIATPTEIVRRDIHTPDRTLLGFLGVDKTDSTNTKYDMWDFDRCVIDPSSAVNNEIVIILLYTNDSLKIKPCGCENGKVCVHEGSTSTHTDRGTGTTEEEVRYMNYIEVATYPQLSYRYNGRKTQYSLSKDLTLTAEQAKEFVDGGVVLNLNGKTLTYDTSSGNDAYIFTTTGTDTMQENTDAKVMICGIATPGATERGSIVANGNHKGAFILGNSDIYLSNLDIKNITAKTDSDKAFIEGSSAALNTYVHTKDVRFDGINLKSDLINAGSRVVFENTNITNSVVQGSIVKLQAAANVDTTLELLSSEIKEVTGADALLSANLTAPRVGTKVKIATTNIVNNEFKTQMMSLSDDTTGANSSIYLQGDIDISNNTLTNGPALIYNAATNGDDIFGADVDDKINITNNTLPHTDGVMLAGFYERTVTFKGRVEFSGNTTNVGKATNKVSAVRSGNDTKAYLDEVVIRVAGNNTFYEWYAENYDGTTQTYDQPIFTQVAGTKLKASDSIIKIRLMENSEDQGQKIYENWSINNIIGEKEAEATFMRDDSYAEEDPFDIYKKGKNDTDSDIYLGSSFVAVRFRLYNYKANVDERIDSSEGYTDAAVQRVEPDIYTLLDTPQYKFDFSRTSVMWEAFAYRNSDGTYDYSEERLYPEKTTNIALQATRSVMVSGYIYNYNNKRHVHEGNIELWTEARNEGHLQATNSFVFLHNDIEITHPLLFTPEKTYHLCLNGHKLIVNKSIEWFNSDTCKLIICDCQKTGSIVQNENDITDTFINVRGGEIELSDVTFGPFKSVKDIAFVRVDKTVKTTIENVAIKEVNMSNVALADNSFIEIETNNLASISNITLKSNKMLSNNIDNSILSIDNLSGGSINIKDILVENNEISGSTTDNYDGSGYILKLDGYENVVLDSPTIKANKSIIGAPIRLTGNSSITSALNMSNVTFADNQKIRLGTMEFNEQVANGVSANFATTKFKKININGGVFKGNSFNANGAELQSTEGGATELVNYESSLTVKNVTFDGTGAVLTGGFMGIVIVDNEDDLFEDVKVTNYNIGEEIFMILGKGSGLGPAGSYSGRTTFRGNSQFSDNSAHILVCNENYRNDPYNDNEGLLLFNGTKFNNNTVNKKSGSKSQGLIQTNGTAIIIASGSTFTKTLGTAVNVSLEEIRLLNTEISAGSGDDAAVYISDTGRLTIGDKVVVKGNKTNIYIDDNGTTQGYIRAIAGHPILPTSDISISVPDKEFNFFDEWGPNYIKNYNYHSGSTYTYLPGDLFKLDAALASNRKVYIDGSIASGDQKLWVSSTQETSEYATLIFFDKDIEGPKEITRQYIKIGQVTKLDRVQVDYISTLSQVWMTESDGSKPEAQEMWRIYSSGRYNDFEVRNYEAGKTYYAYLTKKHIHKICGPDSMTACSQHADGAVHTVDYEFIQVGDNDNIIIKASRSNYIGLSNDLTINQAALDSLANRDIVFCLNGYNLIFEKDAQLTTAYDFTFVNCNKEGIISVEEGEMTANSLISVSGGRRLNIYNINFQNFGTESPVVKVQGGTVLSENVSFKNIKTTAVNGMYDIQSSTIYVEKLSFTNNIASGSSLLDLRFDNLTLGKIGSIQINNNTYTNKLLSLSGTGNMDSIDVENNTMIEGGGSESYGAIYVANGANITYTNDAKILSNDSSINEESKGGAVSVYGRLNFNGNMTLENNKAGLGGAIYVDSTGSLYVNGEANFKKNQGKIGGAIYAKSWSSIHMASAIYDENIASTHGVVAFGGTYSGVATFKNHTRSTKELIYNINDDGTDRIILDKNTLFYDNSLADSIIYLKNVASADIDISYLSTGNSVKSFVEIATGSITIDNATITDNTFTDSVFIINNPHTARVASISVYENKITNAVVSVSGGMVEISNRMTFRDNVARLGSTKHFYVSGESGYFKATEKITMGKKYMFAAYTNGIKVFEKWNSTYIENYDNPQSKAPGRYMVTPENSDTIKLADDNIEKGYGFYKVGSTNSQDIYVGKEGVDFIQLRFIDPEYDGVVFASQNIELGKETKLDKVDTLECDLVKQKWVATMSDGRIKTFDFTSTQTASSSETINVSYIRPHLHKICGTGSNETCKHMNGTSHTEIEYQIVGNAAEFATTTYQYVYIKSDIEVNSTITLASGIRGICLNGHTIKIVGGANSLFDTANELSICNCKKKGGITTGEEAQTKPIINYTGTTTLSVYNINFFGINTERSVINLVNDGTTLYAENITFKNNKDLGAESAINTNINTNTNNKVYLDNVSFENNKNESDYQMLDVYSGYNISTLSFINNDLETRLAWFSNKNTVDIGNLIVKNNKVKYDSILVYFSGETKLQVSGDMIFENNTIDESTILTISQNAEINVIGTMSFINNTAKKHAAMRIDKGSKVKAGHFLFDGNKNTEPNNSIVEWAEAKLILNNAVFKNHVNETDILLANVDDNGEGEIYIASPTFINNKGTAIKLDGIAKGVINGLRIDGNTGNNFTNILNINNSTVSIAHMVVENANLANSAVVITDSTGVEFEDAHICNNTIAQNGSALLANGSGTTVKVKGSTRFDGNTNNIVLNGGSYLKASGMLNKDSKMDFSVSGTSMKLFEGWDKNHIETYGQIASKSSPKRYTYTPENSGLFTIKPTSGYGIYKGGTGDKVSVYAGTKDSYSILSFVYKDEDDVETVIDTQNVIKGTSAIDTHLDIVDSFEYEIENQTWYAPNATGEYNIKWEFKNDVISNLNNDSQIKYARKHIHKICGAKYYDDCEHKESTLNHNKTVHYEDATSSNSAYWPSTAEYINLLNDIEFTSSMNLSNLKGICLNGHKIIIGNISTNFMSISSTLDICDCKKNKVDTGAICVKDGVTLKDSIVRINSDGTFNAYGIRFANISLNDNNDFTTTYTYAIENSTSAGSVYLEKIVFTGSTETGAKGLFRNQGSANQFMVVEPLFTNITLNSSSPLLDLNSRFAISTISVIKNSGYAVPLIKITDDVSVGSLVLKDNVGATGQGLVSIDEGKTLTLTADNLFEGNESQGGGVLRVAGTLIAEKDLIFKNNSTVKGTGYGGALFVDTNGKVITRGKTKFIGNEAMFGSAIYANNISEDALKDMKEPYFEDNTALTRGVVYWSGALKLATPTFANHKPYNLAASTGVRTGIIVNSRADDKLILDSPIFTGNNLVGPDGDASAIRLTGAAPGTKITGFKNDTKDNVMANFVYAEEGNLILKGHIDRSSANNKFTDTILNIRNASDVTFDDLCLEHQTVENAAVYISGTQVKLINEVRVISNITSAGANTKNVVLADDNSYFKGTGIVGAPAFISYSSIMGVSVNGRDAVKIFEGWNAENFEYYDKPQVKEIQYKYVYAPENAEIFVPDEAATDQELYKKGFAGDGDGEGNVYLGTKDNYVTLKYYNDVEEVENYVEKAGDKEYYCYQNIAKDVPTKLDKIDTHEYEIEKQEWYVGYQNKDTYDYLEKFNPADPKPTIDGVNGVVETFAEDQEIRYHQLHIHKACGLKLSEECNHDGHADHIGTVDYNDVNTIEELEAATGYAVLAKDLDVANLQKSINLNSGLKGICLNGHSIMGDGRYGLFNITREFTLCNCKPEKENTGITSDESFTQANDIININTTEEVGIYRVAINDVAFGTGYAVNVEQGNVFIGSLQITGSTRAGTNGVIRSNTNVTIDTLMFNNNKLTGTNPMLRTSDTLNIKKLYLQANEMEDSMVIVNSDTNMSVIISEGNVSANKGAIFVAAGRNLTVSGQVLNNNKAKLGGALYLAGTYKCIIDDPYFSGNEATEKGGAIYIADGGKIQLEEIAYFTVNEAPEGAAIYAENLRAGDIVMPKSEFMGNYSTEGAAITFGGELELSDITFEASAKGSSFINNVNTSSATDKAIISSVSVIDNEGGKCIVLTNVKDGSKVQNVKAEGNDIECLVQFKNISNGNRVYLTNVKDVTNNKFSKAAIVFDGVADAVINNVNIKGNESTGYGALLVSGADTKVYSVGELNINDNINTGEYGAAITILGGANLEEDGGMSINGNRSSQGGAIYLDGTLGVQSQGSKVLKVSTNYINDTAQTKNILVANEDSYVYATGKISDDTQLGFTAGNVNVTAFKYWNKSYFDRIGTTDKFAYTPENSGIFIVDTLSQNAKQEFYKSGNGSDVVIKLGANFTKLHFVTAGKTTEYVTQNVERGADTKLDKVLVLNDSEKWIAPNKNASADFKWQFNRGDIIANYNTAEEFIYKLYTYSIVYTGGSKGGSQTYNNIEYGEAVYAINNPFGGQGFKSWTLRTAIPGIPREYAVGDLVKNVCLTDGGTAYLDARWDGEILIRLDPNGARYGLDIPYDGTYDIYTKANVSTSLGNSYPTSLGGENYSAYNYNIKSDGSGTSYSPGQQVSFADDVTLYLMWYKPAPYNPGGKGKGKILPSGGGGGSGSRTSGGTIPIGTFDGEFGPGTIPDNTVPVVQTGVFTVDDQGNIRDTSLNIVGNIHIGDRVNADGSFTAANGITVYPNGAVVDTFGNIYNPDGSITSANGTIYFVNGDVMDPSGTIYHPDGSTTLPDGTMKDADGIVHYPDGSIMLPDGTRYLVDGTVVSPGGTQINPFGEIIPAEDSESKETPGSWNYDPASNSWKFEHIEADGTKITYKDQWINTKNAQGKETWYTVDNDGNMITGWLKSEGEYFFMSTDPNSRGELVKGTVLIDGKTYTFDQDTGALTSGDIPEKNISVLGAVNNISGIDGTWLRYSTGERYFVKYFDMPDGSRLEVPPSKWLMIDGHYYFFDKYGIPQTGLIEFDEKYYYFKEDGTMQEGGEVTIGDTIYVFDKATGACRTMRRK